MLHSQFAQKHTQKLSRGFPERAPLPLTPSPNPVLGQ